MEKKLEELLNTVQQLEKKKAASGYNDDLEERIDETERSLIELLNNADSNTEEDTIIGALNRLENLRLESGFDEEEEDDFKDDDDLDFLSNEDDSDDDSRSFGRDYDDDDRF